MAAVRGINGRIVEVRRLDSDRFEKAIFFVREEYAGESAGSLKRRAGGCLERKFGITVGKRFRRAALTLLGFAMSELAGAAFALLVS